MLEPLIFTSKGNIPMTGLRHDVEWRIDDERVVFVERYFLGDEVVKESTHVKLLKGASAIGDAAGI